MIQPRGHGQSFAPGINQFVVGDVPVRAGVDLDHQGAVFITELVLAAADVGEAGGGAVMADNGMDQMPAQFLVGLFQSAFQLGEEVVHLLLVGSGGEFRHGAQLVTIYRREEGELEPAGGHQRQGDNEGADGGDTHQLAVANGPFPPKAGSAHPGSG